MSKLRIIHGDALESLKAMEPESVQCCVTSPPYWGLRDYGVDGQLGLEKTPDEYVAGMVAVFAEVRRVLRNDGTLWLNIGDSYANDGKWGGSTGGKHVSALHGEPIGRAKRNTGLKPKDLCGIPWRFAFALQADGWYLRQDIIWHKPNPMPESVTDRCTKAHEYVFLMSKSAKYYYDNEAIKEPASDSMLVQLAQGYNGSGQKDYSAAGVQNPSDVKSRILANAARKQRPSAPRGSFNGKTEEMAGEGRSAFRTVTLMRNRRSVWTVATALYSEAHFATFPPQLIEPMILAGSRPGDVILDPFGGSGTTGQVALGLGRKAVLVELNKKYITLIRRRCCGAESFL